jgi:hypothetical protein
MDHLRHRGARNALLALLFAALAAHCGGGSRSSSRDDGGAVGGDGSMGFGGDSGTGSGDGAVQGQTVTVLGPGVTPGDQGTVDGATPVTAQAPRIDYPLAGAVMPRTVYPPQVMWTPQHTPQSSDIYRVRLDRGVRRVQGYFLNAAGFSDAWQLPTTAWPVVGNVDFNDPIQLTVAVLSGGVLREGPPRVFRTVDAFLQGSVYYWSPPERRIKRIDVGTASLVDFMPNPGSPCIGCHALSRDGSKLAAQLDGSGGKSISYDSFDLTRNLTANPAPTLLDTPATYGDVSLGYNADSTRLVVAGTGQNRDFYPLRLIDSMTGALVRTAMTASGIDAEWSPDNTAVAYTSQGTGSDDLMFVPIASDDFGATTSIHSGASGTDGSIDWHPTWSPNSRWIAFQNGVDSTAGGGGRNGVTFSAGAIWLTPRTGGGATRLDKLDGPAPAESYRPFFTPFDSGGYFWLLFTSGRAYGNATAGVSGQAQVWIAAIADKPGASGDPSEVPYYLAGQETTAPIISPQWAPSPCRMSGDMCTSNGDCCTGNCVGSSCKPPAQCSGRGGACSTNADCCSGLTCGGHICDTPVQ